MIEYKLEILGDPVAKSRQRVNFKQKKTYPNPKTANYENLIRLAFHEKYPNPKIIDGSVGVSVRFMFAVPQSWSKKKRAKALDGKVPMTKRPDIDNLLKSVLDGLSGVAWSDDRIVTSVFMSKDYAEASKVLIYIFGEEGEK